MIIKMSVAHGDQCYFQKDTCSHWLRLELKFKNFFVSMQVGMNLSEHN